MATPCTRIEIVNATCSAVKVRVLATPTVASPCGCATTTAVCAGAGSALICAGQTIPDLSVLLPGLAAPLRAGQGVTLSARRKHEHGVAVALRPCSRLTLRTDPCSGKLVVAVESIAAAGGVGAGTVRVAVSGTAAGAMVQFATAAGANVGPPVPFAFGTGVQDFPIPVPATQFSVLSTETQPNPCQTPLVSVTPPPGFTGYAAVLNATLVDVVVTCAGATIAPANV